MKRDKKVNKAIMVEPEPEPVDLSNKVNVVAQELKFAKLLAGNDEAMRSKVLKRLKAWLTTRSQSSYGKDTLLRVRARSAKQLVWLGIKVSRAFRIFHNVRMEKTQKGVHQELLRSIFLF